MSTLQLELEDDLAAVMRSLNQPLQRAARELIVLELYRRGSLSGGRAAELLGMPRDEFIGFASRIGIAYLDLTADEWEHERRASQAI
jgi:predicted HTH domain antitoxin